MSIIKSVRGFTTPRFGQNVFLQIRCSHRWSHHHHHEMIAVYGLMPWYAGMSILSGLETESISRTESSFHCTYEKAGTTIGSDVSIGHNAIVHGCTYSRACLDRYGGCNGSCRSTIGLPGSGRCRSTGEYDTESDLSMQEYPCPWKNSQREFWFFYHQDSKELYDVCGMV